MSIDRNELSDDKLDLVAGGNDHDRRNDNIGREGYPRGGRNDNDRTHRPDPQGGPRRDDNQPRP